MIIRELTQSLLRAAKQFYVVTLTGPRQSGKTTLLRTVFPTKPYVSLEDPDQRQRFLSDPRGMLAGYPDGAFFDEFQRVPTLPSYLQRIVDEKKTTGLFVLSGSQQLEVMNTVSQSLAGRSAVLRLLPLSLSELISSPGHVLQTDNGYLVRGFYPQLYQRETDVELFYSSYIQTYLERDIQQLAHVKDLNQFQRFLVLCASRVGQLLNASALAVEVGVSVPTIQAWLSILEASYIIYMLPPYHGNVRKRMIKSPKIYFYDVGLACHLLGLHTELQISRDSLRGHLFENMVIMDALKAYLNCGKRPQFFFYRDQQQTEIDLLIEDGRCYKSYEIKSGQTFFPEFIQAFSKVPEPLKAMMIHRGLIYGGTENFEYQDVVVQHWKSINWLF